MKDEKERLRAYYLKNRKRLLAYAANYRAMVRADPVTHLAYLEKSRLYRRKKFNRKGSYKPRKIRKYLMALIALRRIHT